MRPERDARARARSLLLLLCLPLAASAAPLRLESVLGEPAAGDGAAHEFARAEGVRPFVFPEDHGPHPRFRSEWWYLTVNLEDTTGAWYGVQFTAFRQALRPDDAASSPWSVSQLYLGHLALTDVSGGRHLEAERLARGHPRLAGARAEPFRVWVDGWSLGAAETARIGGAQLPPLLLQGRADAFAVSLELVPVKPLVLQGDRGLSRKGPEQASYYYSVPRLAASGTIQMAGDTRQVTGTGWLDREWSTSLLSSGQQGWDWFGLQLDGAEELMAFQLRRDDGQRDPFDQGLWVAADGVSVALGQEDFTLQPLRYWQDERGVSWPVAWQLDLRLPNERRRYTIEAALDDQRMDTLLTYWEGLVRVLDAQGRTAGKGYMELTGYE